MRWLPPVLAAIIAFGLAVVSQANTVPNDPQYGIGNQWAIDKIEAPAAWDISTGSSVIIAIIDSGIWAEHPDLQGKVLPGIDLTLDADGVDYVGHGTGVASIAAAATNNGIGIAGACWGCKLLPVKVYGSCAGPCLEDGIRWSVDHGAKILNISLIQGTACPSALQSALDYAWAAGAVIIAAAGDDTQPVNAPADCNHVLAVGYTDINDLIMPDSNTGAALDLVAPGKTIALAVLSGAYGAGTGTSFSAPFVAGVAGLLFSQGLSRDEVVAAILGGVDDLGPAGWDVQYGWGRLNAYKALTFYGIPPTNTPTATATATNTPTVTATATPTVLPTATATICPPGWRKQGRC